MLFAWLAEVRPFWKPADSKKDVTVMASDWLKTWTEKERMASELLRRRLRRACWAGGKNEALTERADVPGIMSATISTYLAASSAVPVVVCTRSWNTMAGFLAAVVVCAAVDARVVVAAIVVAAIVVAAIVVAATVVVVAVAVVVLVVVGTAVVVLVVGVAVVVLVVGTAEVVLVVGMDEVVLVVGMAEVVLVVGVAEVVLVVGVAEVVLVVDSSAAELTHDVPNASGVYPRSHHQSQVRSLMTVDIRDACAGGVAHVQSQRVFRVVFRM
jgi:hypothetical protein